mgnify:CR=1 FL=1
MDVVDPEIVESESQILMDFELPIADHKSQEQTNQMQREEVAEESVVIEKDFENASLEVRFELKTTISGAIILIAIIINTKTEQRKDKTIMVE